MSAVVSITMSKEFLALIDPKEFDKRMIRFNEAMGNLLLGRQDKLLTGDTGVARLKPAPLQRSFGKWYKGNKRVSKFRKYTEEYEEEKRDEGKREFLVNSGALFKDAVTSARVKANSRGVTIIARRGASKDYQMVHQLGSKVMPKRPPYLIDDSDKNSMILPLETVLLSLFRGSLGTIKFR